MAGISTLKIITMTETIDIEQAPLSLPSGGREKLARAEEFAAHSSLPLLLWLSPAFPIGSFAYSHGLEWAHEQGLIHDLNSAKAWLGDVLVLGGLRNDALLLSVAWQAVRAQNHEGLIAANALALALAGSRERLLETSAQGNAFVKTIANAWTQDGLTSARHLVGDIAYPIAVGLTGADHAIALQVTLETYIAAGVANLTSALVRLNAIGQTDGQRLLAGLISDVMALAKFALTASLEDVGSAAFYSDIASLRHETQYTRLFRS